jgi:hypothetical protein
MPTDSTQADQFIKKLELPAITGTIKILRGKYYFVDGKAKILVSTNFISEDKLKKMVGKKITAVKRESDVLALFPYEDPIDIWHFKCFMCYIPNPEHWGRIDIEVQRNLIKYFKEINVLKDFQANVLNEIIAR